MISITTPAPLWATANPSKHDRQWKPKPDEFALFARAIAARYGAAGGPVRDPATSRTSRAGSSRRARSAATTRRTSTAGSCCAAFPAIRAGSPGDTILVGELAASGSVNRGPGSSIRPLAFLRAFGCVVALVPQAPLGPLPQLQGAARGRDRPPPVQLLLAAVAPFAPTATTPRSATGAGCSGSSTGSSGSGRLISARGGKLHVHYTEFGYQTDPPDPFAGVSLKRQDRWLQEAAYVAWRTPRVHTLSQFRLSDGPGAARAAASTPTGSSRPACCSTTCARSRRTAPSATRSSCTGAASACASGARSAPAAATTSRSSASGAAAGRRVATVADDPPRLLAAQSVRKRSGTYRYRWGRGGPRRTSDRIRVR